MDRLIGTYTHIVNRLNNHETVIVRINDERKSIYRLIRTDKCEEHLTENDLIELFKNKSKNENEKIKKKWIAEGEWYDL